MAFLKQLRSAGFTKPIGLIINLFSKRTFHKLTDQFFDPACGDEMKALSAAFGIFMGIIPIWGLQTFLAIFLAMFFKLNKAIVILFSQISFPPLLPLIVIASYKAGGYWTHPDAHATRIAQYLYGSITLAIVASLATGGSLT